MSTATLARLTGRLPRSGLGARGAGDVDDAAPAAASHVRDHELRHAQVAVALERQRILDRLHRQAQHVVRLGGPRAVHQHVDPAERRGAQLDGRPAAVRGRQVGGHGVPVGAAVGDLLDHPVQAGPVARHHADGGAFACQRERAATADAAVSAGDDGPLPVELQVHDGRRSPAAT